ncbi:hypothetical protein MMC26_005927 [Xylographa opegraphella]|nr:hypothetical protein [Xylographa opegraphella]
MSAANLVRIRDNQRRSRARRKEHLQDTEKRLRELERAGIEVSSDIQKAARKVVDENCQLRSLLRLRGVTDAEIDEHLRRSVNGSEEIAPSPHLLVTGHSVKLLSFTKHTSNAITPVPSRPYDVLSQKATAFTPISGTTEETPNHAPPQPETPAADYSVAIRHIDNSNPPEIHLQSTTTQHQQPTEPIRPPSKIDNTTSCLLAANILAGMSAKSAEEVSAELGCYPGTDCAVDNVTLFQIMDR